MPQRPEVLAPAGDAAAMRAAVRAGADAVYFGLKQFSARARAANFEPGDLPATMRELHAHGVRGYVALNTLVFDSEVASFESAIDACVSARVDAVIVQDIGVARLVRDQAPQLAIHASTQMTCTDASAIEFAKSLGASRVVLARELTLKEIAAIRSQTDVELEIFVHGALCISYSGQCLTSEAIGGRSANRGACAQACRLPYELVVDGVLRDLGERAFLLSPEDLEASGHVPELVALGVRALKIEGRMKGPEYVAAATRLYRHAVDQTIGPDDRRVALQAYTRGSGPGFFDGVDHQRLVDGRGCDHRGLPIGTLRNVHRAGGRYWLALHLDAELSRGDGILVEGGWGGANEVGGRVWELQVGGRDVHEAKAGEDVLAWLGPDRAVAGAVREGRAFKTSDPRNDRDIASRLEKDPVRVALDVRMSGQFGEPFTLEGESKRGHRARVSGDAPVERARSAATTLDIVREKLARLGDTPFALNTLHVDLPPGAMIPVSALNRARRALVDALIASGVGAALEPPTVAPAAGSASARAARLAEARPPDRNPPPSGLFVLCRTEEQAHTALDAGADGVVLDFLELTGTGAALRSLRARVERAAHVTLAPPRVRKPGEEKIDKYLGDLAPDGLLVRSLGALNEAHRAKADRVARIGDSSLNVTNRLAAAEVLSRGLAAFTPSFDLDAAQLLALCAPPFGAWA